MTITRRQFQKLCIGAGSASTLSCTQPLTESLGRTGPALLTGCAVGDVTSTSAILWTRAEARARIWVSLAKDEGFTQEHRRIEAGIATKEQDFNLKVELRDLPPSSLWYFRLEAENPEQPGQLGNALLGQFKTAARDQAEDIRFCWAGDTAGQGWGVAPFNNPSDNPNQGMTIYAAMVEHQPQFFVHSGDQIYADGPVEASVALDNGQIWRNLVTPGKSKVAESLQEFRENFYYNYLDSHYRSFHANTPVYYQWDDHEVINNWYPGESRNDPRYQTADISALATNAKRALFECNPIASHPEDPQRIYRKIERGPLLDLFFLDMRSYRGPNSLNRQTEQSPATDFLGQEQIDWLKASLKESTATWKIICADMPLGVIVTDWGTEIAENAANSDNGPPLGREFEIADLLSFIKAENIQNLHFITADVHYCASHHYHPERAAFKDFNPFWEHISGPLHAGTFAPGKMDQTFGPERVFCGVPEDLPANRPPSDPYQFFGKVEIDSQTKALKISHYNAKNDMLWSREFDAR